MRARRHHIKGDLDRANADMAAATKLMPTIASAFEAWLKDQDRLAKCASPVPVCRIFCCTFCRTRYRQAA
jgi:hypothetical protein